MKDCCIWSLADKTRLIDYIIECHSRGGDGMNFNKTFWTNAAIHMVAFQTDQAALKTADSCQSKWGCIRKMYKVVNKISNASGLSFNIKKGANIGDGGESVWVDYVLVCKNPEAKSLKTKGWLHYEKLQGII
ncbi:uncharacterized protein BJ212DRAFT_1288241, partial [Suillus subaureus]